MHANSAFVAALGAKQSRLSLDKDRRPMFMMSTTNPAVSHSNGWGVFATSTFSRRLKALDSSTREESSCKQRHKARRPRSAPVVPFPSACPDGTPSSAPACVPADELESVAPPGRMPVVAVRGSPHEDAPHDRCLEEELASHHE